MVDHELQLEKYVAGVEFPTHKEAVIRNAKEKEAPQDLINKLDRLPDRELASKEDVLESLGMRTHEKHLPGSRDRDEEE